MDSFNISYPVHTPEDSIWQRCLSLSLQTTMFCLALVSWALVYKVGQRVLFFLWQRVEAWMYLFRGIDIVQQKFDKANGKAFEVLAPDNRYVYVSSPEHIKELDKAPDAVLSMEAATKQMLQPQYTMFGFNWYDHRGTEGVGFIKALRTMLTNNLPSILPDLGLIIKARFVEIFEDAPLINNARQVLVYPAVLKLVVLANAVAFFGKDLAKNEAFMKSALDHVEQTIMCAEIVRLSPAFLAPLIGKLMAMKLRAHETIFNTLLPVAQQRVAEREQRLMGHKVPVHNDCIQWILDTSPRQNPWTADRVVHEIIAIWFGSVHAVSTTITFAVHDLCLHPEYREPLRQEAMGRYAAFESSGVGLPLMDSFIKESARLSPIESQSTRRAALKEFRFADGTTVRPGEWACTAAGAIMQSQESYPSPLAFSGFRFVDQSTLDEISTPNGCSGARQPKSSKLSDVDNTWLVWGTGRITWHVPIFFFNPEQSN